MEEEVTLIIKATLMDVAMASEVGEEGSITIVDVATALVGVGEVEVTSGAEGATGVGEEDGRDR